MSNVVYNIITEPGMYLDGKFGVRLETEVEVVEADIPPEASKQ